MKVKKFNETVEQFINTSAVVCMIIDEEGLMVDSGAFESQTDFDNWILNMINQMVTTDVTERIKGMEKNEDDEYVFINVADAINWYQDYYSYNVYYDIYSQIYKKQPLLYGVDKIRDIKKYNI
jgi:hypothetical protein